MNAMPGSKAFSTWLKTTASYLIPFPVAAGMFPLLSHPCRQPYRRHHARRLWG